MGGLVAARYFLAFCLLLCNSVKSKLFSLKINLYNSIAYELYRLGSVLAFSAIVGMLDLLPKYALVFLVKALVSSVMY